MQTFPAEVVKELREKSTRYRLRVRSLEAALVRSAVAEAAKLAGIDPSRIPPSALERVLVDDAGVVKGAAEAVALFRS